ncbi:hypothetical protein G6F62_006119 [Rhizopus arrhizus]|nr:hypothetical protein G6F62_006119 [Rhizopus arrhizus]
MVNLNALPFPDEEEDQNLHFRGTIHTDGVGVTILKKRFVTQGCYSLRFIVTRESTRYINSLLLANHQELEDSAVQEKMEYRYTKSQQDKSRKSRKYRHILQGIKPDNVALAERGLFRPRASVLEAYIAFLGIASSILLFFRLIM